MLLQTLRQQPGKLTDLPNVQAVNDGSVNSTAYNRQDNRLNIYDRKTNQKYLIDSGSVISILPARLFKRKTVDNKLTLFAANTSPINTYGNHTIDVDLHLRKNLKWTFIVAEIPDAIIGADFLIHYNLVIDLMNQRLIDPLTGLTTTGRMLPTEIHSISTINDSMPYADLLQKYIHITKSTPFKPKKSSDLEHHIITTGPPVTERYRKLFGDKAIAAKTEIQRLLDFEVIRPSSSAWASPIHLVKKKNGSYRLCGDYRKLNSVTVIDKYAPPLIQSLFLVTHGKQIFSTIDLDRAYNQIPVHDSDISKTAITTPWGLYEYLGMPFGLKNATQTFQRYMDYIFRGLDYVFIYIDDILIMSENDAQHRDHLQQVLQRLSDNNLSININKCTFGKSTVNFLGYQISNGGFLPNPDRVEAILNFPSPTTVREMRRFLGMFNHYRPCIKNAAHMQISLTNYLKNTKKNDKTPITWTPDSIEAFKTCKQALSDVTQTSFPAPNSTFMLITDASTTAIGAVLEQLEHDIWKPVGFFSRKLSDTETRYSTYDRELLAIFAAVQHFHHLLEGRQFTIKTDHKPLTYAFQQRLSKASERQLRQLDYISQFTTDITYVKGEDNTVADALSRINTIDMPTRLDLETIFLHQQDDEELKQLLDDNRHSLKLDKLILDNNIEIYCDTSTGIVRPYLPHTLRRTAFDILHNLSHPGKKITSTQLREKYTWPGIKKDANTWAKECIPCQRAKIHRHNRLQPNHIQIPDDRFKHINIDIIILPEIRGYRYCLTMIDRFTRWPVAVPLKDITADTITTALFDNWISHYGTPTTITSDQGSQFESTLFQALAKFIGCEKTRTSPYHPQSNGIIERWHRTLKAALMCSPKPWIDILSTVLLGLRTSLKEDIQTSPAEMVYGTTLRIPGEFFINADFTADPQIFVEKHREYMRGLRPTPTAHHQKSKVFIAKDMQTCTHVFIRSDHVKAPLEPPYRGPYKIIKRITDSLYQLDVDGTSKNINLDRLKPAYITKTDTNNSESSTTNTVPEHHWTSTTIKPTKTYSKQNKINNNKKKVTFKTPA